MGMFFFSVECCINYESRWRSKTNMISLTKNKTETERTRPSRENSQNLYILHHNAVDNKHRLKPTKLKSDVFFLKLCPFSYSFLVICVLEDGSSFSAQDNVNHAADKCRETNPSHKGVFVRLLPVCSEITRALCDTVQTRHRHHGKAQ